MEKRLPLTLILCCLILMGWTLMFPPKPQEEVKTVADDSAPALFAESAGGASDRAPSAAPQITAESERTLELEFGTPGMRGSYYAVFTNRGGRLLSLRLGDAYDKEGLSPEERADPAHWVELLRPVAARGNEVVASLGLAAKPSARDIFPERLDAALWKMEEMSDGRGDVIGVRFTYGSAQGAVLTKEIVPRAGTRIIDLSLGLQNVSAAGGGRARQFTLTPAACVAADGDSRFYPEPRAMSGWADAGELSVESENMREEAKPSDLAGAFKSRGELAFAGVHNKFFACLFHANEQSQSTLIGASWRRIAAAEPQFGGVEGAGSRGSEPTYPYIVTDIDLGLRLGEVGESAVWNYEIYAGPKDRDELFDASPDYKALSLEDLGFFQSVAQVILAILVFFQGIVGNWGWAIILMTLTVRLILFPITRRSQTAMARYQTKMKRVQPKIDAIKEKHANNPTKLREEQGRIMQEEGAMPPLGGCLPMFLQFPVFIGLFSVLKVEYNLRQEPFLFWIRDLSQPDHLLRINFNTHLPFIGEIEWLNVLPFVMMAVMILQQSAMPAPTDEQAARMQKMMRWMFVAMAFFLYSYPSGLALYMITSSSLGLFEIKVIKKLWPIDETEVAPKKGWMMRMAEKQSEQQASMKKLQQQQHMSKQKAQKNRKKRKR